MSISLLTACHPQESNKQLEEAKWNLFQIQMGSPSDAPRREHSLCDYVCNRKPRGGGSLSHAISLLLRVSLAEIVTGNILPGFSMSTLLISPPQVTPSLGL